ncbi:MAG: patatin-like phospholipase family protein [Frankiales bacterium]|nr:MAG: patatin-like phospholipase family protein [Frankiales bacterium]
MTRTGLVLGAGGVLGAAWTIGALSALEQVRGVEPRETDVLVGTSAGSVLAALLGCGVGVDVLLDHQRGIVDASPDNPAPHISFDPDVDSGGPLPPLPRPGIGSARGVLSTVRRPWKVPPMGALPAVLPRGRGSLEPVGGLVDAVCPPGAWAGHPATWIVAMDVDRTRRVVFGRDGAPHASLREAVMASCAIPGWYAPVRIGRRDYVDGGVCSPTSLDLVASLGLDEVVVLSPMTSLDYDRPATVAGRMERRFRRIVTKRLVREVKKVAATGTRVTLLGPGAEDLAAIGTNLMDPRRREQVLETSLRTSAQALRASSAGLAAAG